MFKWLKKIYKRKENNPPKDPVSFSEQMNSRDFNREDENVKKPDLKNENPKSETKIIKQKKISEKDKLKPEHHEFIAKLARKNSLVDLPGDKELKSLVSKKGQSEHATQKRTAGKKIIGAVLAAAVFCGAFYWILQTGFEKLAESNHKENETLISALREIVSQEVQPLKDQKTKEETAKQEAAKQEEEKKENSSNATAQEKDIWDSLLEEQLAAEYNQDTEEFQPDQMTLKVLNRGAPIGSAGKVKKLLINKGYSKTSAKDGPEPDVIENTVFFKENKFMREAQSIAQLLREKENIQSYARKAGTDEEKSEDIVIVLGTLKEFPPE